MSAPSTVPAAVILVVRKGSSSLFVKNTKGEWTLPGGIRDLRLAGEESIKGFAHVSLYSIFSGLVIKSVHPVARSIKNMTLGDDRVDVAIFQCDIDGELRPEAEKSTWFVPIKDVPAHAVAEDMRGIIEMIAAETAPPGV